MRKRIRAILFSMLVFLLFITACGGQQISGTSPSEATALATGLTGLPGTVTAVVPGVTGTAGVPATGATSSPAAGATQITPTTGITASLVPNTPQGVPATGSAGGGIPVTGAGTTTILCQFCVEQVPHAVVLLPQAATFTMVAADGSQLASNGQTACNPVEALNGKQLVICYGANGGTITLNVCTNGSNCTQVPVQMQNCPAAQSSGAAGPAATPATPLTGTPTVVPSGIAPTPTLGGMIPSPTLAP